MLWMPVMKRERAYAYMYSSSCSLLTHMLQLRPDGPGKEQSCIGLHLATLSFCSFIDHWVAMPNGVMLDPGISGIVVGKKGMVQ